MPRVALSRILQAWIERSSLSVAAIVPGSHSVVVALLLDLCIFIAGDILYSFSEGRERIDGSRANMYPFFKPFKTDTLKFQKVVRKKSGCTQ